MKNLNEKTLDLLIETGLNWTVKKESLISSIDSKPTNSFGLFRNDNGAHLATVGKRYEIYQNYELAEAIIEATESMELKVTRGGQLSGGAKVYLQAELPEVHIGNSGMKRWITGLNTHDGTKSIGFGSTGTVIICQNTWHRAHGELSKFRHTITAKERVLEFVKGMRKALGFDEKLVKKFQIMADLPIRDEIFARVLQHAFDADINVKASELSTKAKNKLERVAQAMETEVKLEGNNLWALFNGVTRYTNHMAVKPELAKEYVMTGTGYDTNLVAFDTIMKWIEENSELPAELVEA